MKLIPYLILVVIIFVLVFQAGILASSNGVGVNFEVKDANDNPLEDALVIVQGLTDPNFGENKLTDSDGNVSFDLNQNEFFIYIIYKLSYDEQIGAFNTISGNKNIPIILEKLPDDQWYFYRLTNGEIEFRFKGLDDDTNYEQGDYIQMRIEIRNVAGKNMGFSEDKNIFHVVDGQTENSLRAWGEFSLGGDIGLEDIILKKDGLVEATFLEGVVKICVSNIILTSEGEVIELSGKEVICLEEDQDNQIPEWILREDYRFEMDFFYEIDGLEKSESFILQEFFINNTEWKPEIISLPDTNLLVDEEWTYNIELKEYDPSFSNLLTMINYGLILGPQGMSVDRDTGTVTWTPTSNGNQDIVVRAFHEYFENDSEKIAFTDQEFTLTVSGGEVNNAPVITSSPVTQVDEGQAYTYQVTATDADSDTLVYSLTQSSAWLSIGAGTGLISGTAPEVSVDTDYDITVQVSDGTDEDDQSYLLTVIDVPNPNNSPVAQDQSITTTKDTLLEIQLTATDADSDALTFALVTNPLEGILSDFSSTTGQVTYTPNTGFVGSDSFTFKANDGDEDSNTATVSIAINSAPNNAPVITSSPVTQVDEGQAYTYQVTATDADSDTLVYSLTQSSAWLSIDTGTGLISGTAPEVSVDTDYDITVQVSDGTDAVAQGYVLTVNFVNNAPVITSSPVTQVDEGQAYTYQVTATDADSDTLVYSLTQSSAWLSIDTGTGLISGTAPEVSVDTDYDITVQVSDGVDSAGQGYVLTVIHVNKAPVITSTAVTSVNEGGSYSYQVTATDADGDLLTYSLTQSPAWLSIDSNGLISGTAPEVGTDTDYDVTVQVSDGVDVDSQDYILNVVDVNKAPVITSNPITSVNENTEYGYQVTATDADGDLLTYSLTQSPAWLSIDSNGLISGTAPEVSIDTSYAVSVEVSDSVDSVVQEYVLTVVHVNKAPVITSNPITSVNEKGSYKYKVEAFDFDNDVLTYSLIESPEWLSIDSNGLISGTAPKVLEDTNYNVSVEVSDVNGGSVTQEYTLSVKNIPSRKSRNKNPEIRGFPVDEFYERKLINPPIPPDDVLKKDLSANNLEARSLKSRLEKIEGKLGGTIIPAMIILNLNLMVLVVIVVAKKLNTVSVINKAVRTFPTK